MARIPFETYCLDRAGNAIQGAKVYLSANGTATPVTDAFALSVGGAAQSNFISNADGLAKCWFDEPKLIRTRTTDNGHTAYYPSAPAALLTFPDEIKDDVRVEPDPSEESANFIVDDVASMLVLTGMDAKSFCWVDNIDRVYFYDGTGWMPVTDVDYINVLDYGAHWDLADNAAAFQDVVDIPGAKTVLIPSPPVDNASPKGYTFLNSINLRTKSLIAFVAGGGNVASQLGRKISVSLRNTTNTNPIIDADNDAIPPGNTGQGAEFITFTGISFYQPLGTAILMSSCINWTFRDGYIITFASQPAVSIQNSFWIDFEWIVFTTANGATNGCVRHIGKVGNPNVQNCYLMRYTNCRFSGGPYMEYVNNGGGLVAPDCVFQHCDGENQDIDKGVFVRATDGTGLTAVQNVQILDCQSFDGVAGSTPATAISSTGSVSNIDFFRSGTSNAGGMRIKERGALHNISEIRAVASTPLQVQDSTGAPHGALFGFESKRTGTKYISADSSTQFDWQFMHSGVDTFHWTYAVRGDVYGRYIFAVDGKMGYGDGTTVAPDVATGRYGPGSWGIVGSTGALKTGDAITANRPSAAAVGRGAMFFDVTLNIPIWSTGAFWVNATGVAV